MSAQSTAGGIGDLRDSAKELAAEVAKVRALTGARQVDLVGHSLGGLMPHWYLTKLDGWKYVRNVVALAPANKGTFNSITAKFFGMELGPSLDQMLPTSDFVKELWSSGTPTHPAVHYTSIATIYEDAVVPSGPATYRKPPMLRTSRCRAHTRWTSPTTMRCPMTRTPSTR